MDNVKIESKVEKLELYSEQYPFSLTLRISNFENEASYKKYVKNCEMLIRRSVEYKLWRQYIIDVLRIDHCMITHERMDDVTIEVHHHVPGMYVLVSSLVNKKLDSGVEFCTFDICMEAIELHFKNRVGYVTLLKSMHEKFHNGRLDIPIELVRGDYKTYLREYTRHLDEVDLETIEARLATNEHNCSWSRDNYPVASGGTR